jgi:hypothetical protein
VNLPTYSLLSTLYQPTHYSLPTYSLLTTNLLTTHYSLPTYSLPTYSLPTYSLLSTNLLTTHYQPTHYSLPTYSLPTYSLPTYSLASLSHPNLLIYEPWPWLTSLLTCNYSDLRPADQQLPSLPARHRRRARVDASLVVNERHLERKKAGKYGRGRLVSSHHVTH